MSNKDMPAEIIYKQRKQKKKKTFVAFIIYA